jgi:hypothetical protein
MRRLTATCLLAVAALGLPAARPAHAERVQGGLIRLAPTAETDCRKAYRSFVLQQLRDLHICVYYRHLSGVFVQRFTFTGPDGNVYTVLAVPFATPGTPVPPEGVDVDGVMRPVTMATAAASLDDQVIVRAVLPVAGTAISQFHLSGHWSVSLSLNGRVLDREEFVIRSLH